MGQDEEKQPEELPGIEVVYAKNQVELAKHLGCDRRSIARYLKIEGNPGRASNGNYNVPEWQIWASKHGHLKAAKGSTREELEIQERQLRVDRMAMEMAISRGALNSDEETCNVLSSLFAGMVSRFKSLEHELAPAVVGVSVAEATKRLKQAFAEAFTELSLAEWSKKKLFWSKVSRHLSSLQERYCPMSGLADTSSSTPESAGTATSNS